MRKFQAGPWSNAGLKATGYVILFCFALVFFCLFVCFFGLFFFIFFWFVFCFLFRCLFSFCFVKLCLFVFVLFCVVFKTLDDYVIKDLSNLSWFVLWIKLKLKSRVKQTVRMLSNPCKWRLFLFFLAFPGAVTLKNRLQTLHIVQIKYLIFCLLLKQERISTIL